jgi:hypothetical protein
MAIASAVPGVEVTIEVDNVALPEHQYECDEEAIVLDGELSNAVTKYLEVPSGAEFLVRYLLKAPFDPASATHADIMLDGSSLQAPFRETGDKDGHTGYKYSRTTFKTEGQGYTQTFRFSELEHGKCTISSYML